MTPHLYPLLLSKEKGHGKGDLAHYASSDLSARPIRSATASCGDLFSKRIAQISRQIGISTEKGSARVTAAFAALTPSFTVGLRRNRSAREAPLPSASPNCRFLDRSPVHVNTKSPRPARPASVSARAPIATPSRAISRTPLVTSAANALCPKPSPSTTPAAMAITFLSDPPNSTPKGSDPAYTRKVGLLSRL